VALLYRAGGAWTTAWIGGALATAYAVYCVVVIVAAGEALLGAALVAGLTPMWIVIVQGARMGAVVTREGVLVRNFRRATFVPWQEIASFTVGSVGFMPKVGIVQRRDGEQLAIVGIQGLNPVICPHSRCAERTVERLNDALREHQSAAPRGADGPSARR
jgi:hypothetical protein